ncbi:MAG: LAGLIDADG family homing endonuclease, partial [Candidatus Helarchaeota archaeon]
MNREEFLYALRTDDDYVKTVIEELIFPIRDELLNLCGIELRPYQKELSNKIIYETLKARNQEIATLWGRQCVIEDTLVFTLDGSLHFIKDIGFYTGERDVYRVKTTRGYEIFITDDHPFFTPKGWKTLKELKNNRYPNGAYRMDLRVKIGRSYVKFNDEDYPISDERLIILSYLFADGYWKNPKQSIKFTNNNLLYLDEFKKCMLKEFGFIGNMRRKNNGYDLYCSDLKFKIPKRKTRLIKMGGRFKNKTVRHNCWGESKNPLRLWLFSLELKFGFPHFIDKLSRRQFGLFLNRMFACDGYVNVNEKTRHAEIGLVDDKIKIRALQMLLLKANIFSYITDEPNDHARIRISGKYNIKRFLDLTGLIFGKEEQCRRALRFIETITHKAVDSSWQSVKSIEYVGKRKVYNMHVPFFEKYVANGFLVHNCGKTETLADTVLTLFLFYLNVPLEFRVGWFCPAQSQSVLIARKRIVQRYEEAKELFEDLGVHLVKGYGRERVGTSSPLLIFRNDNLNVEGHVRSLSANPKSNIKGDTLDLIILEDAQEIDEDKMKVDIFPMASKGAPLVLVGVPVPDVSVMNRYFIETIEKNPRNAFLITVDWRRAAALDKNFPKEIEAYERGSTTYRYYIDRYRDHVDKMIKQLG